MTEPNAAADLILLSTAVFDSVRNEPFSGGVAVCGDTIVCAGSKEEVLFFAGQDTRILDFGDRLIMPGFCDGHVHLAGAANTYCSLKVPGLDRARSESECVEIVAAFAKAHPGQQRISGIGWTLNDWGNGAPSPTRHSLDAYFPDTPVYLEAADCHTCWVNTAAIRECGLEDYLAANPQIPALWAPREADGSLTGFLRESAAGHPFRFSNRTTPEQYAQYVGDFLRKCSACGLTALTEVSMTSAAGLDAFLAPVMALEACGELPVRLHVWPGVAAERMGTMEDALAFLPYREKYCSDRVHISGLKSMIDGVSELYTAAMLAPYASDPSKRGTPRADPEELKRWVTDVNALGFSVKLHCIGDYAVRMALDAFAASADRSDLRLLRNAVEHWENLDDADLPRFAQLGAVASFQPSHVVLGKGYAEKNLGMERFRREFRWRDLLNTGVRYSLGTDTPVVSYDPFLSIYSAVTRLDTDGTQYSPYTADQVLTLPEALKGYTIGAQDASGFSDRAGTLEAGKLADLMVWDRNPFACSPLDLKDCCCVCTVSGGKIVYEK